VKDKNTKETSILLSVKITQFYKLIDSLLHFTSVVPIFSHAFSSSFWLVDKIVMSSDGEEIWLWHMFVKLSDICMFLKLEGYNHYVIWILINDLEFVYSKFLA
jgi:hypothetical protein